MACYRESITAFAQLGLPPEEIEVSPFCLKVLSCSRRGLMIPCLGFPGGSLVKNPSANAGDAGDSVSISGSGRSPGGGNDNPFQYSCLENPTDKGAWWATVCGGHKESDMTHQLSSHDPLSTRVDPPNNTGGAGLQLWLFTWSISMHKQWSSEVKCADFGCQKSGSGYEHRLN